MQRWLAEWRSIEDRINGLKISASMVLESSRVDDLSHEAVCTNALKPTLLEVLRALEAFNASYCGMLPASAAEHLKQGLARADRTKGDFRSWQSAISVTAVLIGLRAEVSASLVDLEATGRQRTERAFEHLSRSIVVDDGYRKRWQAAFKRGGKGAPALTATITQPTSGEVACERLGAVHLLLHGIWAYKLDAQGERTDLVLQEKLAITSTVNSAEALVLTEWKVAKTSRDVDARAAEGKRQAALYSVGCLAATELATVPYIVVVTEHREKLPEDIEENAITYRFINVAVAPGTPSKEARRGAGRGSR